MAVDVRKVLASAIANAENNHNLDVDASSSPRPRSEEPLDEALHAARPRPSSRIVKPFSRVRIVVREQQEA